MRADTEPVRAMAILTVVAVGWLAATAADGQEFLARHLGGGKP